MRIPRLGLAALNAARAQTIDPLIRLRNRFREAVSLKQQVLGLYEFLKEIRLAERLTDLARELEAEGEPRQAQILNQLWEILISALEQMYAVLGIRPGRRSILCGFCGCC